MGGRYVQKCPGTHLHYLKNMLGKNHLKDGKPIGGKGRLQIELLTSYKCIMEKAIRENALNDSLAKA